MEIAQLGKELSKVVTDFKTVYDQRLSALQKQADAIDIAITGRHVTDPGAGQFRAKLQENESLTRLLHDKRGTARITLEGSDALSLFERKAIISSGGLGSSTSGVLTIDRDRGITAEARQELTVRDVLSSRPTTAQLIDFVKVTSPMTIASPQVETQVKAENSLSFATASLRTKTVATWVAASKQALDDFTELAGFIESSLSYYVNLAEELQLLSGDNTGENLYGLIPQATAFNVALLSPSAGWGKMDIIGRALAQLAVAKEIPSTFVVLNPVDWFDIRLQRDTLGHYILAAPGEVAEPVLFGKRVVATTSIVPGTFLVGSGSPAAAEIRDRMEMQVEISTEHSDYFTRNLIAIRAEKRLALVVKRPGSFVTGSFTTSPA